MSTVYSSGSWRPSPGREQAFVEAWKEFASWSTGWSGAGQLRLTRDLDDEGRFVSFGDWASEGQLRAWKTSPEFRERLAQVLQHVGEFTSSPLGLVATAEDGEAATIPTTVSFRKDGIAVVEAPVERIFDYMRAGNHPHQAFKTHQVVGVVGNLVTVAVEAYNPDGSTTAMTVQHLLEPPSRIENTMSGGHFDGGRFTFSYTPENGHTKIDIEGEFPALPGMSEADELAMLDGFFTTVLAEDAETIRTWSPNTHA